MDIRKYFITKSATQKPENSRCQLKRKNDNHDDCEDPLPRKKQNITQDVSFAKSKKEVHATKDKNHKKFIDENDDLVPPSKQILGSSSVETIPTPEIKIEKRLKDKQEQETEKYYKDTTSCKKQAAIGPEISSSASTGNCGTVSQGSGTDRNERERGQECEDSSSHKRQKIFQTKDTDKNDRTVGTISKQSLQPTKPTQVLQPELMLVDKYKPTNIKGIIGQQGEKSNVKKLLHWLQHWHDNLDKKPAFGKFGSDDGAGFKAALLSGSPGIGKTTAAQLVCKELDYSYIELNASDSRSKKTLDEIVVSLLDNKSLNTYFNRHDEIDERKISSKHVLIMDEVDGVAGNEDRGGIAELIQLIKKTKIPIICICNDRSHQKLRSLANYCFDLRFAKPRVEQIKAAMLSICYKEKIKISSNALTEMIIASNQDIRQVLHYLSFVSSEPEGLDTMNTNSIKDTKLGPFDALRKVFSHSEHKDMSFQDRSNLFFCDYSLMPLFVFENYVDVNPSRTSAKRTKLDLALRTIQALSFGDIISSQIFSSGSNWSLLPVQAAFSVVIPSVYMSGGIGATINFPSILGRISNYNKCSRLLQELKMHMSLKVSGSKAALNMDYLYLLKEAIFKPLKKKGADGISEAFDIMDYYSLRKDDLDSILELTLWKNQKNPMSDIDSKTKAALTRACNSKGAPLPYSESLTKIKKKATLADQLESEGIGALYEDEEEEEEIVVKPKKVIKKNEVKKEGKSPKKSARGGGRGRKSRQSD